MLWHVGNQKQDLKQLTKKIKIFKLQKPFTVIDTNNLKDISYKQKQKIIITINKA